MLIKHLKKFVVATLVLTLMVPLLMPAGSWLVHGHNQLRTEVLPNKIWNVTFSSRVNPYTVDSEFIHVRDSGGNIVSQQPLLLEDRRTVRIKPDYHLLPEGYDYSSRYHLMVSNGVYSEFGRSLSGGIVMPFQIIREFDGNASYSFEGSSTFSRRFRLEVPHLPQRLFYNLYYADAPLHHGHVPLSDAMNVFFYFVDNEMDYIKDVEVRFFEGAEDSDPVARAGLFPQERTRGFLTDLEFMEQPLKPAEPLEDELVEEPTLSLMPNHTMRVGSDFYAMTSVHMGNDDRISASMISGPVENRNTAYYKFNNRWYNINSPTVAIGDPSTAVPDEVDTAPFPPNPQQSEPFVSTWHHLGLYYGPGDAEGKPVVNDLQPVSREPRNIVFPRAATAINMRQNDVVRVGAMEGPVAGGVPRGSIVSVYADEDQKILLGRDNYYDRDQDGSDIGQGTPGTVDVQIKDGLWVDEVWVTVKDTRENYRESEPVPVRVTSIGDQLNMTPGPADPPVFPRQTPSLRHLRLMMVQQQEIDAPGESIQVLSGLRDQLLLWYNTASPPHQQMDMQIRSYSVGNHRLELRGVPPYMGVRVYDRMRGTTPVATGYNNSNSFEDLSIRLNENFLDRDYLYVSFRGPENPLNPPDNANPWLYESTRRMVPVQELTEMPSSTQVEVRRNPTDDEDLILVSRIPEDTFVRLYRDPMGGSPLFDTRRDPYLANPMDGHYQDFLQQAEFLQDPAFLPNQENVYITFQQAGMAESQRLEVPLLDITRLTPGPSQDNVFTIRNLHWPTYQQGSDLVNIRDVPPGGIARVYPSRTATEPIGSAVNRNEHNLAESVNVVIPHGLTVADVLVTLQESGMLESRRVPIEMRPATLMETSPPDPEKINTRRDSPVSITFSEVPDNATVRVYNEDMVTSLVQETVLPGKSEDFEVSFELPLPDDHVFISFQVPLRSESLWVQKAIPPLVSEPVDISQPIDPMLIDIGPDWVDLFGLPPGDTIRLYHDNAPGGFVDAQVVIDEDDDEDAYGRVEFTNQNFTQSVVQITRITPGYRESEPVDIPVPGIAAQTPTILFSDMQVFFSDIVGGQGGFVPHGPNDPNRYRYRIRISGLDPEDIIRVYDAHSRGRLLASGMAENPVLNLYLEDVMVDEIFITREARSLELSESLRRPLYRNDPNPDRAFINLTPLLALLNQAQNLLDSTAEGDVATPDRQALEQVIDPLNEAYRTGAFTSQELEEALSGMEEAIEAFEEAVEEFQPQTPQPEIPPTTETGDETDDNDDTDDDDADDDTGENNNG